MSYKGQSSVEYTLVIGLALILASPFLVSSQSSIIQLDESSNYLEIDHSMDKFEKNAEILNEKSYPARRVIDFRMPRSVEKVYNPQFANRSALVIQTNTGGTTSNQSVLFDFKLVISNTSELSDQGLKRISLKKHPNKINVSEIS